MTGKETREIGDIEERTAAMKNFAQGQAIVSFWEINSNNEEGII